MHCNMLFCHNSEAKKINDPLISKRYVTKINFDDIFQTTNQGINYCVKCSQFTIPANRKYLCDKRKDEIKGFVNKCYWNVKYQSK